MGCLRMALEAQKPALWASWFRAVLVPMGEASVAQHVILWEVECGCHELLL
jgi:hypothetical protein